MDIDVRELAGMKVDYQSSLEQDLAENDLFVITLMDEFAKQPALKDYLNKNYPIIKNTPEIIIYDLDNKFIK
jgi:hypothetical protein